MFSQEQPGWSRGTGKGSWELLLEMKRYRVWKWEVGAEYYNSCPQLMSFLVKEGLRLHWMSPGWRYRIPFFKRILVSYSSVICWAKIGWPGGAWMGGLVTYKTALEHLEKVWELLVNSLRSPRWNSSIHPSSEHLRRSYHESAAIQDVKDMVMCQTDKGPTLIEFTFCWEKQQMSKQTNMLL